MDKQQTMSGIALAVKRAGTQEKLGERLGVSQQAISQWLGQGWVPIKRARVIEREFSIPSALLINPELVELASIHR
jgi:DNA-binding transcriptional regulator YdaS (Cro superfamily)